MLCFSPVELATIAVFRTTGIYEFLGLLLSNFRVFTTVMLNYVVVPVLCYIEKNADVAAQVYCPTSLIRRNKHGFRRGNLDRVSAVAFRKLPYGVFDFG